MASAALLIIFLLTSSVIVYCVCKNIFLPWCRSVQRREILSKKKYNKLTADASTSKVHTYDEDDDDEDVNIDAENQMMLKRVEYSSRELEQLKLLDAAIDLDSDSLNFPENDNMDLTDNDDEFESLEEATSIILKHTPYKTIEQTTGNNPSKSIFENDTEDESNLQLVTTNLNQTTNDTNVSNIDKGEVDKKAINKKD